MKRPTRWLNGCGRPATRHQWDDLTWVRVFLTKVAVQWNGCWEWTGSASTHPRTGLRYGYVQRAGKMQRAHRAYWEFVNGPVSADIDLDHLCRNPICVNPDHLEPVARRENMLRSDIPWAKKRRAA